jgi:competence protein ComFC
MNFDRMCIVCKRKLGKGIKDICEVCREISARYYDPSLIRAHDAYDGIYCLFFYDEHLKKLIYEIKGNMDTERLFPLAGLLLGKIRDVEFDQITYVPSTMIKRITRGFNPARVLAQEISARKQIPLIKTLRRRKSAFIKDQKKSSKTVRFDNAAKEFTLKADIDLRGKKVLLVDDVLTTGATMNRCAGLLKSAGADLVYTAVIASGRRYEEERYI